MKFEHIVESLTNYGTDALEKILIKNERKGFELVSVAVARNSWNIDKMYLFFKRRKREDTEIG